MLDVIGKVLRLEILMATAMADHLYPSLCILNPYAVNVLGTALSTYNDAPSLLWGSGPRNRVIAFTTSPRVNYARDAYLPDDPHFLSHPFNLYSEQLSHLRFAEGESSSSFA